MRRTGRVIFVLFLLLSCMMGLWMFQAWKESKQERKKETYHNVYIIDASGTAITIVHNEPMNLESTTPVSGGSVQGIVADLYLQDGRIVKIVRKPEYVTGTIQKLNTDKITLDEYGEVELAREFTLYHISREGTVTRGHMTDLAVGQPDVRFVAAGNQICAAIVPEKRIDNIRVLLNNNEFSSYDQGKTVLTATTDFSVREKGSTTSYKKGQKVTFEPEKVSGEIIVDTGNKGKIRIESLHRQCGIPEYRGTLHITKNGNSLHLVNELSLEEYLYSVVPSEMPTEYSMEALKAQAVCARTYASGQIKGNRLAEYGAHVDDSVSFQVYNNQKEDSRSVKAVNATKNQVVAYEGKLAATYFYSASCGSRAGTKDVWFTKRDVDYLPSCNEAGDQDLSKESEFRSFIQSKSESYDSESPWYRWSALVSPECLRESIEKKLTERFEANSTQIQVKQKDGTYRSERITSVGEIESVAVKTRGRGGVVSLLEIVGSERTIRVYTEYNIRTLLGSGKVQYKKNDGEKISGLSLLPSGFFCVEKKGEKFLFTGGGYGHGVGMSQNGANTMAESGKNCQDILSFYFPGTKVEDREVVG
ncbi:MAG: SpoIID/LytB domain-containing protein [Eubacterium sp.]|nr:SpoIID/LytB domain-containing protein [Eubacterium sp.]